MTDKKQQQLKMNPSTAAGRLIRDILYQFIVESDLNNCYHCNLPMSRETFSIEHKIPWLDSEDPVQLYFDLQNISYSHQSCNSSAARSARRKYKDEDEAKAARLKKSRVRRKETYDPAKRSERYKNTGN